MTAAPNPEGHTPGLRLVAYLRVSTVNQVDGYGLDVQRQAITEYARAGGLRIIRWCDDVASGSLDALDRDGLACALDAIETGTADAIIVARLDRLARQLTVQEACLALVWSWEGRAFTADGGEVLADDPDDPMRTAMRQMMGVFAELERAMIAKRLRDGRRAKAQAGGYAGGGIPYGQTVADAELAPDAAEQSVIARIQTAHDNGASLRDIATALNSDGIPTKRGGTWHASTVLRIIQPNRRPIEAQAAARRGTWARERKANRTAARRAGHTNN